jgi:uncharacterized protein (DUF2132 family)
MVMCGGGNAAAFRLYRSYEILRRYEMTNVQPNNPLHGITLEMMLNQLVDLYGWDELSRRIRIRCFADDPSIKSSLKFLRRTGWARNKVEVLYLETFAK